MAGGLVQVSETPACPRRQPDPEGDIDPASTSAETDKAALPVLFEDTGR
jgi:hypothetical protein